MNLAQSLWSRNALSRCSGQEKVRVGFRQATPYLLFVCIVDFCPTEVSGRPVGIRRQMMPPERTMNSSGFSTEAGIPPVSPSLLAAAMTRCCVCMTLRSLPAFGGGLPTCSP